MNTHFAAATPASIGIENKEDEEVKTPMIKHSNGYPQLNLINRFHCLDHGGYKKFDF